MNGSLRLEPYRFLTCALTTRLDDLHETVARAIRRAFNEPATCARWMQAAQAREQTLIG